MATNIDIFLQKTKKLTDLKSCVLLLGDETYYLDQASQLIRALVFPSIPPEECNIQRFDKFVEADINVLEEFAYSSGFFSENRLVVISDPAAFTGKGKQDKIMTKIIEIIDQAPEDCYFLFILNRLEKSMRSFKDYSRSNLYKHLDTKGSVIICESPRSYEVGGWLSKELKQRNIKLDHAALDTITTYCNYTDKVPLSILVNEFEKLKLVYPKHEIITLDEFMQVSQLSMQVSIFKLVEYIWKKDSKYVLNITDELLKQGEAIEGIVFILTGQVKRAIQLKLLDSNQMSLADFIRETKMTEFIVNKTRKAIKPIPIDDLKALFSDLVQLMYQIRIGNKQAEDLIPTLLRFCQ